MIIGYIVSNIETPSNVNEKGKMLQSWAIEMLSYLIIEGDTALNLMIETIKECVNRMNEAFPSTSLCMIEVHKNKRNGYIECYTQNKKEMKEFRISYQMIRGVLRELECNKKIEKQTITQE